jgi:hypothetical protein
VICILPEWLGQVLTLLTVGFALAGGLLAFGTIDNIGARKHRRMDMKDSGHRQCWGSGGIALGLAASFVYRLRVPRGRKVSEGLDVVRKRGNTPINDLPFDVALRLYKEVA